MSLRLAGLAGLPWQRISDQKLHPSTIPSTIIICQSWLLEALMKWSAAVIYHKLSSCSRSTLHPESHELRVYLRKHQISKTAQAI